MKKRLIGSAIILAVVIPCFLIGGVLFNIFACFIGGIAIFELINADKDLRKIPNVIKALSLVSIPLVVVMNMNASYYIGVDMITLCVPFLLFSLISLFNYKKGFGMNEVFKLSFISLFISFICLSFITIMRIDKWILLYIIIIAVATDVFAYLGGRLFGKHKFTKISPNKTIEGCVCGAVFGTALSYVYYVNVIPVTNGVILFGITILLSIIGQCGDLVFSLIKRENDIKDYSHLIPGHGGICDRLDSLSFIAMLFLILFRFF